MRYDLHTHYYPLSYFELIRRTPGEFAFASDPRKSGAADPVGERIAARSWRRRPGSSVITS
jgi:hypothetical protein